MSSLENWKPLTALCMLGATMSLQSLAVRFEAYLCPSPEKRDELFAQALYEVAEDWVSERGEVPALFVRIRHELASGVRMERMSLLANDAFTYIGLPKGPFLLPDTADVRDLGTVFGAHLSQHPEWRDAAMAVSDRFIALLEEQMTTVH